MTNPHSDWEAQVRKEHELRTRLYILASDPASSKSERVCASKQWWRQVQITLKLFIDLTEQGAYLTTFPSQMLQSLCGLVDEFAIGNIPQLVRESANSGSARNVNWRRDVACAVAYVEAVRRDEIHDSTAFQTVCSAFGVSKTTVENWLKDRDRFCDVLGSSDDTETITLKMTRAGELYKSAKTPKNKRKPDPEIASLSDAKKADIKPVADSVSEAHRAVLARPTRK